MFKRRGWHATITALRGRSNLHPQVRELNHPAASLLDRMRRNGVPVVIKSPPWTPSLKQARFTRGPHKSAHDHAEFLASEFLDFCRKGYWMLLPYELVHNIPELRISPIGVVPQRERRPRVIVDYSFYEVNRDTVKLAPQESMQFGKALNRMLQSIADANPAYGDCYVYKVDVSDGFYRVWLCTSSVAKLGVALPKMQGLPELVAFPLVLPMGWTESPPYFSVLTETVCDLTNRDLERNIRYRAHPLEAIAAKNDDCPTTIKNCEKLTSLKAASQTREDEKFLGHYAPTRNYLTRPLAKMDVFVDDFCGTLQDTPCNPATNQRRVLFHNLDRVFRKNDCGDPAVRKEPNAINKLEKGDASLNTCKRALGWDLDGKNRLLKVPPHRVERAATTLRTLAGQSRAGHTTWQSMLGDLRNLTPGIPGGRGQFSLLQAALTAADQNRVRITKAVKAQLEDLRYLVLDLERRPTHVNELVPKSQPLYMGASDAAKPGMGGVWLPHVSEAHRVNPLVWRQPFERGIQQQVVSAANPRGTISNSDLELAATIAQQAVLAHHYPVAKSTTHSYCDNTPAVSWQQRGSTTTTGPAAYLLRVGAMHQRHHQYLSRIEYLPGPVNVMADDASRRWDLSDESLLTHFNTRYPQRLPWRLSNPPQRLNSALTSSLYRRRLPPEWYLADPDKQPVTGTSGAATAQTCKYIQAYLPSEIQCPTYKSSPAAIAMDVSLPVVNRCSLERWKTPCARLGRRFPHWGPQTPAKSLRIKSTFGSNVSSEATSGKTQRQLGSDPFQPWHSKKHNA